MIRTGRTAEVSVDQGARRPARAWGTRVTPSLLIDILIALVLPVAITSAMYLLPFVRNPSLLPFGSDTKKYLARAEIVKAEGPRVWTAIVRPSPSVPPSPSSWRRSRD